MSLNISSSIEAKIFKINHLSDERNALNKRIAFLQEDIAKDFKVMREKKYFQVHIIGQTLNFIMTFAIFLGSAYFGLKEQWLGVFGLMALMLVQTYTSPWSTFEGPFMQFKITILLKSGSFKLWHYYMYKALNEGHRSALRSLKESS